MMMGRVLDIVRSHLVEHGLKRSFTINVHITKVGLS